MARPKKKKMCHDCLEDFEVVDLVQALISPKMPHHVYLCKKCLKKDTRVISHTKLT